MCAERDLAINIAHAKNELKMKKEAVALLKVKVDSAKLELDRNIADLAEEEKLIPQLKEELETTIEKAVDSEPLFDHGKRAARERIRKRIREELNVEFGIAS